MHLPVSLIAAVATQLLCQLFKVVFYSIKDRRLSFHYFVTSGGMPSSHSAFVTSLAVAVALHDGIASEAFAVAAVFGFIVMHDAYRLRGTVEKQSRLLNALTASTKVAVGTARTAGNGGREAEDERLPEMLGHTLPEIGAGIATGALLGAAFTFALERIAGLL